MGLFDKSESLDTQLEMEAILRHAEKSGLQITAIPGALGPDVPFEENEFVFSTETLCSMKQQGWPNAQKWLAHYPDMETLMKAHDEKYLQGDIL